MSRMLNAWWVWFLAGACIGGATAGWIGVPPGPATIIVAKVVALVTVGVWWVVRERRMGN